MSARPVKSFHTYRRRERIRDPKTGQFGIVAAVNENCIVIWLDDGRTLYLAPVEADMRLQFPMTFVAIRLRPSWHRRTKARGIAG